MYNILVPAGKDLTVKLAVPLHVWSCLERMQEYSLSQSIIWADALIKNIGTLSVSLHSFKTECVTIQKYAGLRAHLKAVRQ